MTVPSIGECRLPSLSESLHPSHQLGFGRTTLLFVHVLSSAWSLFCACAPLYEERLRKRFLHAADTACIKFLYWIFPESVRDIAWTTAGRRRYAIPHS